MAKTSFYDVESIRKDFPIFKNNSNLIYFDNASTTQKPNKVINAISDYYENYNANVHRGIYEISERSTESYENVRDKVVEIINAKDRRSIVFTKGATGGLGCFTPDSFPIFDQFKENVYIIADSNHGYKMIGVGDLVSDEILGKDSSLLKPFRFNRYAEGKLHPVSSSPFPWS